jgi:hypothetical protein
MPTISTSKTDYIILSNSTNIGTNIYIKSAIITYDSNNDINTFFTSQYGANYKNIIILSQHIINYGADQVTITNNCLITQNNIKNNMKFIHNSSNLNSKILFVQNQNISDNSKNYLLEKIEFINTTTFYHLNYYFNNYFNSIQNANDYFNISIKDFIYKDSSVNSDIVFDKTNFKIIDFSSIPLFSNASTNISLINYVASDFSSLFIDNNNIPYKTLTTDVSINKLYYDLSYNIYNNIYSYNKLTLDFKNINAYKFALYDGSTNEQFNLNSNDNYNEYNSSNTINTFMIKTNNFDILNTIKANSKILFHKNNIFFQNVKALDICSNFYTTNANYKKTSDLSNTLFLSIGRQITGITQNDLYKHSHILFNKTAIFDISKIVFSKNINSSLLTSANSKYNSLLASTNNLYLLDFTFNYKNINNNNNNNAINYNAILYNYIEYKIKKEFDLNLSKIIDFSYINNNYSNNYYINNVNNILTINNKINNTNNITTISYEDINNALRFKFKDLSYNNFVHKLNASKISEDLYSSFINYDVRYNYGQNFIVTSKLDIFLRNNSTSLGFNNTYPFNNIINSTYYSKLNFYALQVINIFTTALGSDFENVDCIFIYHDPATETDPSFLYPYNNIEIIKDTDIDTLEKAIVVLPGARTSTTNSTFIPARNGSNLSRKMIQGLIGLNNVPRLLSIVPYDTNFITGRGFVNQYQIDDTCNDYEDQVNNKINSIKHYSAKENITSPNNTLINQNFANIVRSNARNRLSQSCIENLRAGTQNTGQSQSQTLNTPITTPFKLFFRK